MKLNSTAEDQDSLSILRDDVPVLMPELPVSLVVNTPQQFKAISEPVRLKILNIIRHQPATAKQLAGRLEATPGAIGHHLQVLEAAGLARVTARRVTRGIIAKYYTRTARIFSFDWPPEITASFSVELDIISQARDEMAESLAGYGSTACMEAGLPHARLRPERVAFYSQRLNRLIEDFLQEGDDPNGEVFGLALALYKAPPWQAPIKEA